jgi:hypothetical protein
METQETTTLIIIRLCVLGVQQQLKFVRLQVLKAMAVKVTVFWDDIV